MNNVNLERLNTFVVAALAPTFSEAARRRSLSVSAISQQVRALEGELGHPLFERLGRRVRLTAEGRQLLDVVRTHLGAIDEAISQLGERKRVVAGRVTVGCPRTFGQHWLMPRLAPLLARAPGLSLKFVFAVPSVLESQLLGGELDLAVLTRPPEAAALESEVLTYEAFVAVAAAKARFGALDEASARRLSWVVFAEDRPMHEAWWSATFGAQRRGDVNVVVEAASLEWMLELVVRGVGVAVLPDYLVAPALARRALKRLPLRPRRAERSAIHVAWRRGVVPTARLNAVRDAIASPRP
ncbi:MAG: LysR family transcriptional regulator [Myxococcaceae bacterium]|jgi:DNA-binding transcriptional LysR family regulator|nr:LysR family transcriptional regulator [Myxococcaceae bacterium]MCA3010850.1 LysR family transcriptional regulator [Myxococcaceae bacterium]